MAPNWVVLIDIKVISRFTCIVASVIPDNDNGTLTLIECLSLLETVTKTKKN